LESFFENYRSGTKVFCQKTYVLILTKHGLGYILGDSFHKLIRSPWQSWTAGQSRRNWTRGK
jgi:hypothetical protein